MNDDGFTLDVPDPQVLVYFDQDPNNLNYHHRLLLNKLGPGRWVGLTPDHELVVLDLNNQRHVVLDRRSRFPAHLQDRVYAFDPVSRNELEGFKRRARTMNIVLGEAEVQEVQALVWVFSDPSSAKLGEVVPQDHLDQLVVLGDRGLLEIEGTIEGVKEIQQSEVASFKESARGSLGDLRAIGQHKDNQNRRFVSFADALSLVRESKFDDWGFNGPRATLEFLTSIRESISDLQAYHFQWLKNSGANQHSSIVYEHRNLLEVLRLGLCRDQLDVTNLLSFELVTRRIVQIEIAISRSPSSPEFSGLDILMESPISESGAAHTKALDSWLTDRLKERANIQKQSRLYREEQSLAARPKGGAPPDADQAGWRRRAKAKAKAKSSAGGASFGAAE